MDIQQTATAVTTALAPFIPFLVEVGKESGKKLAEVIAEKGGESAWEIAQKLWQRIKTRFSDDTELNAMTSLVASQPDNGTYQKLLIDLLTKRMESDVGFADDLLVALGGEQAVQQIISRKSIIINATQEMEGSGTQKIHADDNSYVSGVKQTKK